MFTKDIKHPDEFNLGSGKTQLCNEFDSINQSLRLILTSSKGELFGDPSYGCRLNEYLLKFHGAALDDLIVNDIIDSINSQETRVTVSNGDIEIVNHLNERVVDINIRYHLRSSNMEGRVSLTVIPKEENTL